VTSPAARRVRAGRAASAAAALLLLGAGGGGERRVLLLGDSITAGAVSGSSPELLSGANGPGYASRLADALGPLVRVSNLGIGGTTTTDWRERLAGSWPVAADVAVVLLGTNDALAPPSRPPTSRTGFAANLRAIASELAPGFGVVVLLTPPPAPAANEHASPEWTARLAGYRDEVRAACAELERVVCGPVLDSRADFHEGNIHPNAAGHAKIADALAAALRPLLADPVQEDREDPGATHAPVQ
jgi:lysophospholipase L1-like esterase